MKLKTQVYWNLVEALRRFTRFGSTYRDSSILGAWTGLGYKTWYQEAINNGYMTFADHSQTRFVPRAMAWLVLTPKGAEIVQRWLDQGFSYKKIEAGEYPDRKIEP